MGVLLFAMVSFQTGAALAKQLFPAVGPQGAVTLRVVLAAIMLLAVQRPWRGARLTAGQLRSVILYGASLGGMNLCFYMALKTVPLGICVALEFTGPLAVAVVASRRLLDLVWVAMAVAGLLVLSLPHSGTAGPIDPLGVAFALGAGAFWGLYIVFGRRAGELNAGRATALGMVVAALIVAPFGVAHAGWALWSLALLPVGAAVGLLSSALPYTLELFAMVRLPDRVFSILMSLDPAIAAVSGWLLLGEQLTPLQIIAIGCVVIASLGSMSGLHRSIELPS